MMRNNDKLYMIEYIKNVLYFATASPNTELKSTNEIHYFSIDNELVYENYYGDFGPLNLGCVYKYCKLLNEKIKCHLDKQTIVHYTSIDPKKKANAAFLLGCFGVLYLSLSPRDAMKPLLSRGMTYRPFQDATQGDPEFTITIMDCLKAIKKASDLGFFNFKDFNYDEYERLDRIAGGDLNWIVPGKFLAFVGPVDYSVTLYHPAEMYIDYFKDNNVQAVIRLNKRLYDAKVFNEAGIKHYDLFFTDGSCPPRHILFKFLQVSEDTPGALAVHCKAGLGRTGSLIGSYLIKHYRMSTCEAIGWMRICRPGSVIGHQQGWLQHVEAWLIKQGDIYRKKKFNDPNKLPTHVYGVYSIAEKTNLRRPVALQKTPLPPPPMKKYIHSDISPPARPRSSKLREAPVKVEKDWYMRSSKDSISKMSRRSDGIDATCNSSRRSGAGEPRTSRAGSNPSSRSFLMKSQTHQNERMNNLNSSITVKPHYLRRTSNISENGPFAIATHFNPYSYNTAEGSTQPSQRRRLGRSPSPSPQRSSRILESTRATNTPIPKEKNLLKRDTSTVALREALSRLKVVGARAGAIDTVSIGVASLGARRDAPAPQRAPSVRSDERAVATQGDMLNSIKLQRRFREREMHEKEKFNKTFNRKSASKENINPPRRSSPTRPSSPKGRRIVQNTLH